MKAFPRDIEVSTMTERHVGIENELGVPSRSSGFYGNLSVEASSALIRRGMLQSIGQDGGGREFRTTPISLKSLKQVRGYKYLCEYYDILQKNTQVLGSGGTHVHISILDKDHPNMESNATAMGIAFFVQFQKIAGRQTHWAGRFQGSDIDGVRRVLAQCKSRDGNRIYSRYSSMLNPTRHKTLEFRGPKGSNDKLEVLAWVEFIENVVKLANRRSVEGVKFQQLLTGDRIQAYVSSLKGEREITKADLERTFNGAALY